MPELAEVEYYRQQWNGGIGHRVVAVQLHARKRLFHKTDCAHLQRRLTGATLLSSAAHGKQMLYRFSGGAWLGLHLGMTGKLREAGPGFTPGRHDHLVLVQRRRALVFSDPRVFGRARFYHGPDAPPWWSGLPPELTSNDFTVAFMSSFLRRHRRAPIKAVLLLQGGFPGVGNWMADEILWRAQIHPCATPREFDRAAIRSLWQAVKCVSRGALRTVGRDFSDPPKGWFYHERWEGTGHCPRHGTPLPRATIGGRTTAWCPRCQPRAAHARRG